MFRMLYAHSSMNSGSGLRRRDTDSTDPLPGWSFLTNHGQVLVCIARDPEVRLRDIGQRVGITERAAHRIVAALVAAGYITREREGRRNRYAIDTDRPLPDALAREQPIGALLEVLGTRA